MAVIASCPCDKEIVAAALTDAPCAKNADFFFNDTATTEIYTLSLHDALPISRKFSTRTAVCGGSPWQPERQQPWSKPRDRKSTRLNSSHPSISYAVFCLK